MPTGDVDDELSFECPRCHSTVQSRFWGPCSDCRASLIEAQRREGVEIDAGRFEPAMHVVPNQVATKE